MIDIILNSSYMGNVRFDLTVSTFLIALSQSYAAHLHHKPNILGMPHHFLRIVAIVSQDERTLKEAKLLRNHYMELSASYFHF